ncbi:response regulator [Nonlabens xiamenensis]|uniref:response regulator n=1 Tax=Nonlabens xiamenensis TaxID=2341043 RepID=UPI000F60731D|nr:response regulator [Nonlabens xiamenensis]
MPKPIRFFYSLLCATFLPLSVILGFVNFQDPDVQPSQEVGKISLDSMVSVVRGYYYSKDYELVIENGQKLLQQAEERNDLKSFVNTSSLLGSSLLQLGDTVQSQEIFERSLRKAKELDDTQSILTASIDLGNVYAISEDYSSAIKNYQKVLPLAEQVNDTISLFLLNYNIGESFLELDQAKDAKPYIESSEKYVSSLVDAYKAGQKSLFGKYYYSTQQFNAAADELVQGIKLAESSGFKEILVEIYKTYASVEEGRGNYASALDKLQKFNELNEEKYQVDKINAVESAVAKYKVDKIQQELKNARIEKQLTEERASRNSILALGIAVAVFLSFISILLYIIQVKRKKLLVDLQEKNKLLALAKEKSDLLREAKDALFSRISHELRTPMYGIIGISNLMIDNEEEAHNVENIKSLKYSGDYLLSLINNVLEMNRMNRVQDDFLKKEAFNLRKACHYAMDSARYMAQNDSNQFNLVIDPQIPKKVIGDRSRLSQVLINLLGNAAKFTEHGEVRLTLTSTQINPEGHYIRFEIKDNGIGIPAERQSMIFEESTQIKHLHENEGTGLGLPISKKIIELHGAEIELTSAVGEGTTIAFTICYEPVKEVGSVSGVEQDKAGLQSIETSALPENLRLLVVDDNKINQIVTRKILESAGARVELTDNGKSAVELMRDNTYDMVFMDINMPPGIDGFEASRQIREFDKETPIIALTAVEQREIKQRMEDSAMNDYVIKPFEKSKFYQKILKHLNK